MEDNNENETKDLTTVVASTNEDNTTPEIVYDEAKKTITGLNIGDKIQVTIVIKKTSNGYILFSQKVERVGEDDKSTTPIIDNLLTSTFSGGNDQSSDIYILPKTSNKRKIKQVCNKTISRKHRSLVENK